LANVASGARGGAHKVKRDCFRAPKISGNLNQYFAIFGFPKIEYFFL
jgi:hypothetical protein